MGKQLDSLALSVTHFCLPCAPRTWSPVWPAWKVFSAGPVALVVLLLQLWSLPTYMACSVLPCRPGHCCSPSVLVPTSTISLTGRGLCLLGVAGNFVRGSSTHTRSLACPFHRQLPRLPQLLSSESVNLRIAAGEAIALLFELARDLEVRRTVGSACWHPDHPRLFAEHATHTKQS